MIQFNLLPDVKLEYIKAERTKRLFIGISTLAGTVAIVIFVLLLFVVDGVQKKNLSDLNGDIKSNSAQLMRTPNLNKILTIQNQLAVLPSLDAQKPVASRLFGYLSQLTPSTVMISNATTDFTQHTMTITGSSSSLDDVNTFVDTLKFTTYTTDSSTTKTNAFSDVVLAGFSRTDTTTTYSITLTYDPLIFDIANNVTLTVPNTVTTRSVIEQPTDLFKTTEPKQ